MEKQSKSFQQPLLVSDDFLVGLDRIVKRVQKSIISHIADQNGISEDKLAEASLYHETLRHGTIEERQAAISYRIHSRASATAKFSDGSSVEEDDITAIREILAMRSSPVTSLSVIIGSYDTLQVQVAISATSSSGGDINIAGKRAEVREVFADLNDLFENHQAPYALFRRSVFVILTALVLTALSSISYFVVLTHIYLPKGSIWHLIFPGAVFVIPAFFGWISASLAMKVRSLFPFVEFSFGRSVKRRKALRTILLQALGLVISPTLFFILPLLLNSK